jgi:hypothetical protein
MPEEDLPGPEVEGGGRGWRRGEIGCDSKSGRTDSKPVKGRLVFFTFFTWSGVLAKRLTFMNGGSIYKSVLAGKELSPISFDQIL